ncbi:unnamed protein product, partial [Ectocarpus sp. 4 AP-2014]
LRWSLDDRHLPHAAFHVEISVRSCTVHVLKTFSQQQTLPDEGAGEKLKKGAPPPPPITYGTAGDRSSETEVRPDCGETISG